MPDCPTLATVRSFTLNQNFDKRVLKASFATWLFHLSVRPSVSQSMSQFLNVSMHRKTQSGRMVARSGLFLLSFL